ncbi:MAG: hypothetical protein ABSG51_04235 [Terracidiphilus sp.]|jgi:hypothetical protein
MKPTLGIVFLLASMTLAVEAWATTLPDACGNDKVKFDVSTQKDQPAPGAPEPGMAQVVFVETFDQNIGLCIGCKVTTRVGLDGTWVGANKGNSYFALTVAPGEHHVCADWQSLIGKLKQKAGMASFTAEAGRVYYYEVKVKEEEFGGGKDSSFEYSLVLTPLSDDEGKYRVKAWELATSTPK